MPGLFITLEGGEGAGKSTQARRLAAMLAERGWTTRLTREPGGSPRAEMLREVLLSGRAAPFGPLAEAILFNAARADHLRETIRPALARDEAVICDRFADSTRAYQGALGNIERELIDALEHVVVGDTTPDITLILDLPPELGLARAAQRRGEGQEEIDRFEREALSFHKALRQAFLDIAAAEPQRCIVIDASRGVNEVSEAIRNAVQERLDARQAIADKPAETM